MHFMRFSGYKNLVPPQIKSPNVLGIPWREIALHLHLQRDVCFYTRRRVSKIIHHIALDVDFEGWLLHARTILCKAALDHSRPDKD